jgi:hypothetical protein
MIQRVQSIWLFFSTAAIISLFLFPYLQILNINGTAQIIKVTGVYENIGGQSMQTKPFLLLTIATVLLALIPFSIIFFYKDRKKQMALCYVAIVAIICFSFWLVQNAKAEMGNSQLNLENYSVGVILPSAAILFIFLAIRGIKYDEKLLKSADRLR